MTLELTLHTVSVDNAETKFFVQNFFDIVVGIEIDNETSFLPENSKLAQAIEYDESQIDSTKLVVPSVLALRSIAFFKGPISRRSKKYTPYNCHTFADFMEGQPSVDYGTFPYSHTAPEIVSSGFEATYPLKEGVRGVIGESSLPSRLMCRRLRTCHSLIGLGKNNPRCLQITNTNQFMALAQYDSLIENYHSRYSMSNIRLYTAEPSNSA